MPRLFIAAELSPDVKTQLSRLIENLRHRAPSAKWVNSNSLHLTLEFLGDFPEEIVPELQQLLSETCLRHSAHTLLISDLGVFGAPKKPRVLWLGLTGDVARFQSLQKDIAQRLLPLGHIPEGREFIPHLTLARSRSPGGDAQFLKCTQTLKTSLALPLSIEAITLFESHLGPQGAVHRNRGEFPLKMTGRV